MKMLVDSDESDAIDAPVIVDNDEGMTIRSLIVALVRMAMRSEFKTARIDEYREEVRELKEQRRIDEQHNQLVARRGAWLEGQLAAEQPAFGPKLYKNPLPPENELPAITNEDWGRMVRSVGRMKREGGQ